MMNGMTRGMRLSLVVAMTAAGLAAVDAKACSGLYVGRAVSADGLTLLARTVDSVPATCKRFEILPAVTNRTGRHYSSTDTGAEWPLPPSTYKAVTVPSVAWEKYGRYEGACANEKGLMITGTVTGYPNAAATNADPYVEAGFGEGSLPGLLISCSATAREAIELFGKVVTARGHAGGEIYMFADKDEAWYLEVYTGHQWAAVRMPEDCVMVIGNRFMLREFDPASPDALCSEGLVKVPERGGFLKRGERGLIDLAKTYALELDDDAAMRVWMGHRRFAPATAGKYTRERVLPLFYRPERKVSLREIQETMRWRYEGTEMCPETSGNRNVRTIGVGRQSTCHVMSVDPTLPPDRRCTLWVTLSNAEHAPYLPLNAAMTALASGYDVSDPHAREVFNASIPAMHFRRLAALTELDRGLFGTNVRGFWRTREDAWMREFAQIVRNGDATAITACAVQIQRTALEDAKRLFDELSWYVVKMNFIPGDYCDPKFLPKRDPFVPGLNRQMR